MQTAIFSIINYKFDKVNINLDNHIDSNLNLSFEPKGIFHNKDLIFELQFKTVVIHLKAKEPFVEVNCQGFFKFENITKFEEIPNFFYRNSIAILFPYIRAYISLVTTQANVPGVILPTLNLSNLESVLRENTITSEQ